MIQERLTVRLGKVQLNSVTLAISHLIEQQYAQKISDEQFASLEKTLLSVYLRGRNSAIIPWYDSFKWSHDSTKINHTVSGSIVLGKATAGSIRTELTKDDPAEALNLFIDELLRKSKETDENDMPLIFLTLSVERRAQIKESINKVLSGNVQPIIQATELKALGEKL